MANYDNQDGFTWVKCLLHGTTTPLVVKGTVTASQTITKQDAITVSSGVISKAATDSGLIHGVAIESVTTGAGETADILFIPALPWYVFEAQCHGTYASTSHDFNAYDITATTGEMAINLGSNTESVFHIIGPSLNPKNDYTAADNARAQGCFIRSSYLPLLAATS